MFSQPVKLVSCDCGTQSYINQHENKCPVCNREVSSTVLEVPSESWVYDNKRIYWTENK